MAINLLVKEGQGVSRAASDESEGTAASDPSVAGEVHRPLSDGEMVARGEARFWRAPVRRPPGWAAN
jgi:hypothetical protein